MSDVTETMFRPLARLPLPVRILVYAAVLLCVLALWPLEPEIIYQGF